MGHTITIRLDAALAEWLKKTAERMGVSQGRIVREQIEKARAARPGRSFMRLAGCVRGAKNLSTRKGFTRS